MHHTSPAPGPPRHTTRALAWLCLTAALSACGPAPAAHDARLDPAQEPGAVVHARARDSVALINAGAQVGAGFFIDDHLLVTAAHVVRDAHLIEVEDTSGWRGRARLIGIDEVTDLALLALADDAPDHPPLDLASDAPSPGVAVWTIGHPGGQTWSITGGVIARVSDPARALVAALPVGKGSSGGPVLRLLASGEVEVLGVVTRSQGEGFVGQALAVTAPAVAAALPALSDGARVRPREVAAFVRSVSQRSPLVHQVILAREIEGRSPADRIVGAPQRFVADNLPAIETLHVNTSWRYFFTGEHTFRYRVARVAPDGTLEILHAEPWRAFKLEHAEASHVHRARLQVDFPSHGLHALLVETDGALSALYPFIVAPSDGLDPALAPPDWFFDQRPAHHLAIVAARVTPLTPDDARPPDAALPPADGARPPDAEPAADRSGHGVDAPRVVIEGTFNEFRPRSFPTTLDFDALVRWGQGFAGEHTYALQLVDGRGEPLAVWPEQAFALATDLDSVQRVHHLTATFDGPGLYFLIVMTDGGVSRAIPIWVRDLDA